MNKLIFRQIPWRHLGGSLARPPAPNGRILLHMRPKHCRTFGLAVALVILASGHAAAYPRPGDSERVSVATGGGQGTTPLTTLGLNLSTTFAAAYDSAAISSNGRYVAFVSGLEGLTTTQN